MSLLALLAAKAQGSGPDPEAPDPTPPAENLPYTIPASAPYNVPTKIVSPTFDGSGAAIHPDVIDFGTEGWRGHRYWMAMTPYPNSDDLLENPSILVSEDAFNWKVPDGLTNPLYPTPPQTGGKRWNSDTDLVYDPDTDELVLFFRIKEEDMSHKFYFARSNDGVTWPAQPTPLTITRPGSNARGEIVSPGVIRRGPGDWWMFVIHLWGGLCYYRSTGPEGDWGLPTYTTNLTWPDAPPANNSDTTIPWDPWHVDVIWHNGAFRAILDNRSSPNRTPNDSILAGSSPDGVAWTWNEKRLLTGWNMYRATMQPHESGTHYRVWYSYQGWATNYTQIPMSEWPAVVTA